LALGFAATAYGAQQRAAPSGRDGDAGVALVASMTGAAVCHVRARDFAGLPTVAVLSVLSVPAV
jgi:hypothetical protein